MLNQKLFPNVHKKRIHQEFHVHRRSQGGPKGPCLPQFLEHIVILCFERCFSKQSSVIRVKLKILPPPNVWAGYATGCRINWFIAETSIAETKISFVCVQSVCVCQSDVWRFCKNGSDSSHTVKTVSRVLTISFVTWLESCHCLESRYQWNVMA